MEEVIMAEDQIRAIEGWLESVKRELRSENISLGELLEIDDVFKRVVVEG